MNELGIVAGLVLAASAGCVSSDGGGTGGTGGAGGDGHGAGDLGAPCAAGDDCASGICVGGRCTVSCDGPAACPPAPEWTCAPAPGSGTVCQCTPSGDETCDGHDNDCNGDVDDGATCPSGVCQDGACSCPPSSLCGSECVDLTSDAKHCGSCDVACPPESTCGGGECACAGGKLVCDGACTDVQASAEHCGDCTTVCGSAEICAAGRCSCTIGTSCGGSCVDTENDPTNCGGCDHGCEGGGCAVGLCEPVDVFDGPAMLVTTDATHVYFTTLHAIMRAPLGSNVVEKVADVVTGAPGSVVTDATNVYFADPAAFNVSGNVLRVPKSGGTPSVVGTGTYPFWLAVSATSIYWADATDYTITRADLDGANPTVIAVDEVVGGIATNATHVFWCSYTGTGVRVTRAALDGSGATILAETPDAWPSLPSSIALDGAYAYWGNTDPGGKILRVPLGGGATEVVATTAQGVWGMAVDATRVYFTDGYWKLNAVPVGGGAVQELVADSGNSAPMGIALSPTSIYWAAEADQKLRRVAKP